MKRTTLLTILFFYSTIAWSQKVFFKSSQAFSEKELTKFYSSITISGDLVLFNACDYNLYAYNKQSLKKLWETGLGFKANKPVFAGNNRVYARYYENENESTVMLDAATGTRLKLLPIGPLETTPREINGILYGTAIYDGGCILRMVYPRSHTLVKKKYGPTQKPTIGSASIIMEDYWILPARKKPTCLCRIFPASINLVCLRMIKGN